MSNSEDSMDGSKSSPVPVVEVPLPGIHSICPSASLEKINGCVLKINGIHPPKLHLDLGFEKVIPCYKLLLLDDDEIDNLPDENEHHFGGWSSLCSLHIHNYYIDTSFMKRSMNNLY
ncbi:unnamed protein product [Allacma fusca]|uniref:Uncharacterized protein n=1 Tax=Allacma fusca TaxID=39272 RepID=A0A8J2PPA5_9HEXA|nr:unnamed protein product [Allacma fusca]